MAKCSRAKFTIPKKKRIGEDEAKEKRGEEGKMQEIKRQESE